MERAELLPIIEAALQRLVDDDRHLFLQDASERCLAARLACYLQQQLPAWSVDVEYNRDGHMRTPKQLELEEICANRRDRYGRAYVLPDLIVHQRGDAGPNLVAMELKKTTNPTSRDCDIARVRAYRAQYHYQHGVIVELETRQGQPPDARIQEWFGP